MERKAVNPFVCDQPIIIHRSNKSSTVIDIKDVPSGDDIISNPTIYNVSTPYVLDRANNVKVYTDSTYRKCKMQMTGNANKLLIYISETLRWGDDYIKLHGTKSSNFMKEANISSMTTMRKCIEELVRYGFICSGLKQGYYWVNPHRIFNGNRVKTYNEFLKEE